MKMNTLALCTALIMFAACAPKLTSTSSGSDINDGQGNPPATHTPDPALLEKVDINGMLEESSESSGIFGAGGKMSLAFDKAKLELIVFINMPGSIMFWIPEAPLPSHPDIFVGTEFDGEGNLRVKFRIPVRYVLAGANLKDGATLPSGEKLPPTPAGSGELPGLAIEMTSQRLYLYIGVNSLGAYVILPQDIAHPLIPNITAKVKNKEKEIVGYLTYVSPKNGHRPGLFLGTRVPPKFAKFLEDYLGL